MSSQADGHGYLPADPALLASHSTEIAGLPVEFIAVDVVGLSDDGTRTVRSTFIHGDELHHVDREFTAEEWAAHGG